MIQQLEKLSLPGTLVSTEKGRISVTEAAKIRDDEV